MKISVWISMKKAPSTSHASLPNSAEIDKRRYPGLSGKIKVDKLSVKDIIAAFFAGE
jgi:hypothetical protein